MKDDHKNVPNIMPVLSRSKTCVKVNQYHYRPEVPRGLQKVKVPRFHDNGTGWW